MPDASTLLTFLLALAVLEITPGPDMMLIIARGVGQGCNAALLTVFDMIFVAGSVQISLLFFGLASLVAAYRSALTALQWVGAAYLIYLGGRMIPASFGQQSEARLKAKPVSGWRAVREGTLIA